MGGIAHPKRIMTPLAGTVEDVKCNPLMTVRPGRAAILL